RSRALLLRLYLGRGVLALAWAAAFARAHDTPGAIAIGLLVAYPLIDAVSSLIDYRSHAATPERRITAFNGVLSTFAAAALGVAGSRGAGAALTVFGAWAVVSGAAQVLVGLRRRGREVSGQWTMSRGGGLPSLGGSVYAGQAVRRRPPLQKLSSYATGGGVFFIVQAGLLAWRSRQASARVA